VFSRTTAFGRATGTGTLSGPLDASQFSKHARFAGPADAPGVQPVSANGNAGAQGNIADLPFTVHSLPVFTRSFPFQGQTFQYTMVGKQPQEGGTTNIGVQPFDIAALGLVFLILLMVALIAGMGPGLRAGRLHPMAALLAD